DPIVSALFLVRRLPSGEWVYVAKPSADMDRDGRGESALEPAAAPNDRVDVEIPGLDAAWHGKGTLVRVPMITGRPGFYAWSEPIKK
ncbi:hypothetical protein ABTN22_19010, partial [Acinetobacter baumannii]